MLMIYFEIAILVLVFFEICYSIATYGSIACNSPIESWLIGFYIIIFFVTLLGPIVRVFHSLPMVLKLLIKIFYMEMIFFVPVWNVLGTCWIIKIFFTSSGCLPTLATLVCLCGQIIIYGTYVYVIQLICSYLKIRISEKEAEQMLSQTLESYYNNMENMRVDSLQAFVKKNKVLLEKMKLLAIERQLIKDHFSRKIALWETENECSICLRRFTSKTLVASVTCSHEFHFKCLVNWLKIKPNCPLCRQSFRPKLLLYLCHSDHKA